MDQLREYLVGLFGEAFAQVYIQPPAGMSMVFPCLIITRDTGDTKFADNQPYRHRKRYTLTGVSDDPDSGVYDQLVSLPTSRHERSFAADNLNHDVFKIIF